MRIGDKILYVFMLLCLAAIGGVAIAVSVQAFRTVDLQYWVDSVAGSLLVRVLIGVIGGILVLLALRLCFAPFSRRRAQRPQALQVQGGEGGSAFVSIAALDAMVQKVVRKQASVRDIKSSIDPQGNEIAVRLRLTVNPDTVIPALMEKLEADIKEYVKSISGITVRQVRMLVDAQPQPVRGSVSDGI